MAPRLVACPSCSRHVKLNETHCLHCGARLRSDGGTISRTAGAVLLGLSLTACGSDDSGETMGSGNDSSTGGPSTMSSTMSSTDPTSDTTGDVTSSGEAEYGVPETGEDSTTGFGSESTSLSASDSEDSSSGMASDTDTTGAVDDTGTGTTDDTGEPMTTGIVTTGIEPLYGVMESGEPEYGVASTGIEPDYGVGEVGP